MKVTTIGQGQTLFKEGAKCDVIYFIKSGQVEISRIDEETGKKIILKTLGPESVVGTMAFLLGLERSATAVCLTEVGNVLKSKKLSAMSCLARFHHG